jgi:hypothetical protein
VSLESDLELTADEITDRNQVVVAEFLNASVPITRMHSLWSSLVASRLYSPPMTLGHAVRIG